MLSERGWECAAWNISAIPGSSARGRLKNFSLTGDSIGADEAHRLGMVSKIFPADQLSAKTELFARRVAELPTMTALTIKDSVNQSVDAMGFTTALDASFTIHQLNHAHWPSSPVVNPLWVQRHWA